MDEVLQIEEVFSNTSRGVVAKAKDLIAAFGTDDRAACCRVVLEKGELQVGELERKAAADSSFRDIAKIVAEKLHANEGRMATINAEFDRLKIPTTLTPPCVCSYCSLRSHGQ